MSHLSFLSKFRGHVMASFAAGALLFGLSASGAQAAFVTFSGDGATADSTGWTGAANALGTILEENFDTDFLNPPNTSAALAFGTLLTFGNSVGSLGEISGNQYNDRANSAATQNPFFLFSGLGVTAFGADFNLGPNSPGTGLNVLITFVDDSIMELSNAILSAASNDGFVGFFGVVSDDLAIRSILFLEADAQQFDATFETFSMDNVRFVAAIPIPAALPLFLSALAALGFVGRRRKRLAAA